MALRTYSVHLTEVTGANYITESKHLHPLHCPRPWAPSARRSLRSTLNRTLSLDFALVVLDPKLPPPLGPLALYVQVSHPHRHHSGQALFSDSHREISPQSHQTVNVAPQRQDLEKERKSEAKRKQPTMSELARHRLMQPRSRPSATLSDFRRFLDESSGDDWDGTAVGKTESFVPVRPVWFESDSLRSPGHPAHGRIFFFCRGCGRGGWWSSWLSACRVVGKVSK